MLIFRGILKVSWTGKRANTEISQTMKTTNISGNHKGKGDYILWVRDEKRGTDELGGDFHG